MQPAATPSSSRSTRRSAAAHLPLSSFSPAQLSEALLSAHEGTTTPLEELIATGTAAFELIRHLDSMDLLLRLAFEQLEKQFVMYAGLVEE